MMALFDLRNSVCVIVAERRLASTVQINAGEHSRCHWDIPTIDDLAPVIERVGVERHIVASTKADLA